MHDRLADAVYATAWSAGATLPPAVLTAAARSGADAALLCRTRGTRALRQNLRRVVPANELNTLVRKGFRSYARYWAELFALPAMDPGTVLDAMQLYGRDRLDAAVGAGRGVIIAVPHSGNWDIAGWWLATHYGRLLTVAQRLRPDAVFQRFVRLRRALGIDVLAQQDIGRAALGELRERLARGGVVCLVADRDLGGNGVPVRLFGAHTRMPSGPARLAAATGAVLLPAACWFTRNGWAARIRSPITVTEAGTATQRLADVFAEEISAHPADWHMLAPVWS